MEKKMENEMETFKGVYRENTPGHFRRTVMQPARLQDGTDFDTWRLEEMHRN